MNKTAKTTSVLLAIVLQTLPVAKQALTAITDYTPNIAIIFRWGVGLSALLGGVDAVSGASTVITSAATATGTNGVPFSFRLTTGPQVASSYTAAPLPPGLTLTSSSGRITGTPTQPGVTVATVKGCDGGNGCTPTATLTITILAGGPAVPSITAQPSSVTVTAGNPATFSVTATGATSYQWRFNAANIAGATSSSYSIANAQAANAGAYSVVVSNSAGAVTSANATLTVNPAPVAPSITTPPASQTITAGSGATFNVAASGTAPLYYQWRFNGANISGATAASYVLANAQAANAGGYSVVVSNVAGTATSVTATLTVNPPPVAPSITTPPASQSVVVGANVSFSVAAAGTAPLTYQWRFNNANIAGATSSTYNLNTVQLANAGNYSCLVSNIAGSVTSAAAVLTVSAAPVAPTITAPPATQTVTAGANVNFSVVASGTAPLFYQWLFNAVPLASKTSSTLALSNVQAAAAGNYSVLVSNSVGFVTSVAAILTVNPPPPPPVITADPTSQTVATGSSATFTVTATGSPLTYQWKFNGANLTGATSGSLTLNNVQAASAGAYSVVVSNVGGSVTSASATLTVLPPPPTPPTIVTGPASQTVATGTSASFTVAANGTGPLFYQWRFNDADLVGATSATFTVASAHDPDAGNYTVVVSNSVGTVTSTAATLTVVVSSPAVAGVYQGLFYDTNGVALASSGYFAVKVKADGSFKAAVRAGTDRHKFKGKFDTAGHAVKTGLGKRKLNIEFQFSNDVLTGHVTDGQWNAALLGDRDAFDPTTNPAPFAGAYGLVVPVSPTLQDVEDDDAGGNSGSVVVNRNGVVKFSGKLLNGLKTKQTTALSKTGNWPFYVVLPRHHGIALGWINFDGVGSTVATGNLLWLQPTDPAGGGVEFPVQVRVVRSNDD